MARNLSLARLFLQSLRNGAGNSPCSEVYSSALSTSSNSASTSTSNSISTSNSNSISTSNSNSMSNSFLNAGFTSKSGCASSSSAGSASGSGSGSASGSASASGSGQGPGLGVGADLNLVRRASSRLDSAREEAREKDLVPGNGGEGNVERREMKRRARVLRTQGSEGHRRETVDIPRVTQSSQSIIASQSSFQNSHGSEAQPLSNGRSMRIRGLDCHRDDRPQETRAQESRQRSSSQSSLLSASFSVYSPAGEYTSRERRERRERQEIHGGRENRPDVEERRCSLRRVIVQAASSEALGPLRWRSPATANPDPNRFPITRPEIHLPRLESHSMSHTQHADSGSLLSPARDTAERRRRHSREAPASPRLVERSEAYVLGVRAGTRPMPALLVSASENRSIEARLSETLPPVAPTHGPTAGLLNSRNPTSRGQLRVSQVVGMDVDGRHVDARQVAGAEAEERRGNGRMIPTVEISSLLVRSKPKASKGVDSQILKAIPISRYTDNGELRSCAVCLEDFVGGESVMRLPCFHTFHRRCVSYWLKRQDKCPMCAMRVGDHMKECLRALDESSLQFGRYSTSAKVLAS